LRRTDQPIAAGSSASRSSARKPCYSADFINTRRKRKPIWPQI